MTIKDREIGTPIFPQAPDNGVTFADLLVGAHGERVQPVINEMSKEVELVGQISAPFLVLDALMQTLYAESHGGYRNLPNVFNIGQVDPRTYYVRTLTEVPGIDEARGEFEKGLSHFLEENPSNKLARRYREYLASYC